MITARAHGRVNLIGEHTDYNGGWVFPTAIPQFTEVQLTPRSDQRVHLRSHTHGKAEREGSYVLGEERLTSSWIDFPQAVTWVLRQAGHSVGGFEVAIESHVPEGCGLSSSAALEVALLRALRQAFDLSITDVDIARFGQRAENEFVGARIGIMDQMACTFARAGEALFLDTLTLEFERVPISLSEVDLFIVNSEVAHDLAARGEGYNRRREQCEQAARELGVKLLREIEENELDRLKVLPELLRKRARHVITENGRVHRAVEAFRLHDWEEAGRLFYESHFSMRDDYEVSVPEVDLLVELANEQKNVYGARLTGGGFGGAIVGLARSGTGAEVARTICESYRFKTGRGRVLVPEA